MQQAWEQAWNNAQPALSSIQDSLSSSTSPDPRIIRVGQLDSELLDQELVQLLQDPLNKTLALVNVCEKLHLLLHLLMIRIVFVWSSI
jgi:peroxin-2